MSEAAEGAGIVGASAFVAMHAATAAALGQRLADLVTEPEAFLATLRDGLRELSDPQVRRVVALVSPGVPADLAVRAGLLGAVRRPIRRALRQGSSATALWLAQRIVETEHRDLRLFALLPLLRSLGPDPELTWQLLRRMGGRADDWIEVDALADLWARGVLAETFRWAELEQLVYAVRAPERRLVGATLATLPNRVARPRRQLLDGEASGRALSLVRVLMGDDEPLVQKSLAWAIREWTPVDPEGVARLLREEAATARAAGDGARAWVIRETLSHQPPALAEELRAGLHGLRRRPDAGSTSQAAAAARPWAGLLASHQDVSARQGDRYARSRA